MKLAGSERNQALMTLVALLAISPFTMAGQSPTTASKPAPATPSAATASKPVASTANTAIDKLPKLWHIDAKHKDFRVEVKGDVFHAEWVNLPAEAAKKGAYIRTTCRRAGSKWVGTSSVLQEFADPKAPAGKDITKMCHLTVRFEVDSITPEKITYHSEVLRDWDYSKCQVLRTDWEGFAWVPKK